jgi:hypothetical protein
LERTDFSTPAIGADQLETILGAGIALQESAVIEGEVDVEGTVNALLDDSFTSNLSG